MGETRVVERQTQLLVGPMVDGFSRAGPESLDELLRLLRQTQKDSSNDLETFTLMDKILK